MSATTTTIEIPSGATGTAADVLETEIEKLRKRHGTLAANQHARRRLIETKLGDLVAVYDALRAAEREHIDRIVEKLLADDDAAKFAAYRSEVRETFGRMSDAALAFQNGVVRGGIDREELDREIARRDDENARPDPLGGGDPYYEVNRR